VTPSTPRPTVDRSGAHEFPQHPLWEGTRIADAAISKENELNTKKATGLVALAVGVALPLSACGGGGNDTKTSTSSGTADAGAASKGGTLYWLTKRAAEHMDPQRTYIGRDIFNQQRLVYRGLLQFPSGKDGEEANTPIADVATDTGKSEDGGKKWTFTIKPGVKWEDGKDTTCEDFKYGFSRNFATDVLTGGPSIYPLNYLPSVAKAYKGPYKKTGQDVFDKAVSCSGSTLTFNFEKAWPDFPLAIAGLNFAAPYRADKDQGDKSNYQIFSNGPYKAEGGAWKKGTGATFVRNTNYDAKTDGNRQANPDKVQFVEGLTNEIITQRLIADGGNDKYAVTDRGIPPAFYNQITGKVAERATNVKSPYTFYLLPNFNKMKNLKVRQALAMSTDRAGYVAAIGGEKAGTIAKSVINPGVPGYKDNPSFTMPDGGDPAAAKKLLQEAGVTLPYPITYTYQGGTPTSDNAAAALKAGWDKAGFNTKLAPLTDTYYDVIQNPANSTFDVTEGGWGADYPSLVTVLTALFDSRINITEKSNGQDYGNYKNPDAEKLMDEAASAPDINAQIAKFQELDALLGKDVAYIPTYTQTFYFLHGSGVTNYNQNPAVSMFPDLGVIGVKKS
jgi:peptide/nickel transport system substrate-binding protein